MALRDGRNAAYGAMQWRRPRFIPPLVRAAPCRSLATIPYVLIRPYSPGWYISYLTYLGEWMFIGCLFSLVLIGAVAAAAPGFALRTTNTAPATRGEWAWLHYKRTAQVAYEVA
jgi:hypothetical protein